ncbi:MAG: DUF3422 domain-containing protein [Alphaproteobacteria bacterium]|nr:DUF3422 domain-containing protein [Alphaproteobacteria bacterium]
MVGSTEHPLRYALVNETHARPFQTCIAPERVWHYAVLDGQGDTRARRHVTALCDRYGVAPPPVDANHYAVDLGKMRLKWEQHTEFASFTFFLHGDFDAPFGAPLEEFLPKEWLDETPGALLVASTVTLLPKEAPPPSAETLGKNFFMESVATSVVSGDSAQIWTDFRVHADGHSRILIHNRSMPDRKAGRIVQRLLEIETYRLVALLGLPLAREASAKITEIDSALAELTQGMTEPEQAERDAGTLRSLTRLSADIEQLATDTAFRFGASRAYYALVKARVAELREKRIEGFQTIEEFVDRRLSPAIRTCESTDNRIDDLSRRATRTANLMRTRVDFALQQQNQQLLTSMERRAGLQLRLQQTVEGLSVAAVTYYAVGLLGYIVKGGKAFLPGLGSDVALAVATPIIMGLVWSVLRRYRRKIQKESD